MTSWQDGINGAFELAGSLFILRSILQLHRDKQVHGVHWWTPAFFAAWGLWNLYYYPHLGQWLSFAGGVLVTVTNLIWVFQLVYYGRRAR